MATPQLHHALGRDPIVPESVKKSRVGDVLFRELIERPVSPIIMSHRLHDRSPELATLGVVISGLYGSWGYAVPHALNIIGESA